MKIPGNLLTLLVYLSFYSWHTQWISCLWYKSSHTHAAVLVLWHCWECRSTRALIGLWLSFIWSWLGLPLELLKLQLLRKFIFRKILDLMIGWPGYTVQSFMLPCTRLLLCIANIGRNTRGFNCRNMKMKPPHELNESGVFSWTIWTLPSLGYRVWQMEGFLCARAASPHERAACSGTWLHVCHGIHVGFCGCLKVTHSFETLASASTNLWMYRSTNLRLPRFGLTVDEDYGSKQNNETINYIPFPCTTWFFVFFKSHPSKRVGTSWAEERSQRGE